MRGQEPLDRHVERGRAAGQDRVFPDRAQHHRRQPQVDAGVDVHRAKLALPRAALDDRPEQQRVAHHHFLLEEPGEFGKVAGLADHQLGDARQPGRAERRPPLAKESTEEFRAGGIRLCDVALGRFEQRHDVLPHHRLEQVFLAGVVQVQRALADAGARGDVVEPRGGVALLDELVECGIEQLAGAGLLAAFPARRLHARSGGGGGGGHVK